MSLDATFRPYVVAGFLLIILIALPFRIKSQATGEKLDRTQEGMAMLIGLRLAGAVLWVGGDHLHGRTRRRWPGRRYRCRPGFAGRASALFVITAVLLIWTLRSLGPNLTDTVVTRQAHTLVTRGPYRWVRHPFYDCMALFTLSIALTASNWFLIATGIMVFSLLAIALAHRGRQAAGTFRRTLSRVPRGDRSFCLPKVSANQSGP